MWFPQGDDFPTFRLRLECRELHGVLVPAFSKFQLRGSYLEMHPVPMTAATPGFGGQRHW
ncbi:MAG: hypothetical protein VYE28_09305 [Planctomycetota bacterium]|nr:hypothetical protein [Planctomycetota bacterium]MEC7449160.1 hypothetical protein [Planctomycetota bacterium]MEC8861657.1 hypothetical protein [Planctomycetota bacterium]MEE3077626.1 hypothetical protein [Planctomycetota bacterium]